MVLGLIVTNRWYRWYRGSGGGPGSGTTITTTSSNQRNGESIRGGVDGGTGSPRGGSGDGGTRWW